MAGPDHVTASDRHRALVTIAPGRDLTRRAIIDALVAAGYTPTSAEARKISSHPLIRHIGPDRYRIIDDS
ncbi:MAG TPA: hypothetical protein VIU11_00485 [Nakamurella sp.]